MMVGSFLSKPIASRFICHLSVSISPFSVWRLWGEDGDLSSMTDGKRKSR
jgi:hypothetical protein